MDAPVRGFVTATRAANWEESLVSGNGCIGVLVLGDPAEEVLTFSHERLFLPTTPALPPIDMAPHLPQIRLCCWRASTSKQPTLLYGSPMNMATADSAGQTRSCQHST